MNLQPRMESFTAPTDFLRNSVGMEYKTAGATLASADFAGALVNGYIPRGTAVYRGDDGLYHPWDTTADTGTPATAAGAGLTSHDVKYIAGQNPIVGVLVAGHPLRERCYGVNAAFEEATRGRLVFDV